MRYETNGFIRSMLALMLVLALGGGVTAAVASQHEEEKEQQGEQQSNQEQSDSENSGDYDPEVSFGSALGGDEGSPLGDDSEEE